MKKLAIIILIILSIKTHQTNAQAEIQDCHCSTVQLTEGEEYVLSAWSREETNVSEVFHYENPKIEILFVDASSNVLESYDFYPKGDIIETWQKIEDTFTVPSGYANVIIRLRSTGSQPVYFDDIRIHPFNSNMKSFVYDPTSLRLVAELDENNYSTFYEYDSEGGLVRIKKETEKGTYTIQETRSKTAIKQ